MTQGECPHCGRPMPRPRPPWRRPECTKHQDCNCPICPLDGISMESGVWYADEGTCSSVKHRAGHEWVTAQRKIARNAASRALEVGYFTFAMLNRGCVIRRALKGLDPNRPQEPQERKWLEAHPPKRELTEAERAVVAERFKEARG